MSKLLAHVAAVLALGISQHARGADSAFDVLDFVNPLIGTTNGGNFAWGLLDKVTSGASF
jgi:hypothetical protein